MATFNININAQPVIPYIPQGLKIQRSNCTTPLTETIPLGIVETTNTIGTEFIFKDYTGVGWNTIRIYDVEYSAEATFYVEYAGSKLLPNVDPNVAVATIDVTTVNANESIPTFQIEIDASPLDSNEFLKFTVEVEDTATNLGGKVDVYFYLLPIECPPIAPREKIVVNSSQNTNCFTEEVVTVQVPTGSSRYVYGVISDGFGSITGGTLPETITANKQYTLRIDANNQTGTGTYSVVQLFVKDSVSDATVNAARTISRQHSGNIC